MGTNETVRKRKKREEKTVTNSSILFFSPIFPSAHSILFSPSSPSKLYVKTCLFCISPSCTLCTPFSVNSVVYKFGFYLSHPFPCNSIFDWLGPNETTAPIYSYVLPLKGPSDWRCLPHAAQGGITLLECKAGESSVLFVYVCASNVFQGSACVCYQHIICSSWISLEIGTTAKGHERNTARDQGAWKKNWNIWESFCETEKEISTVRRSHSFW